MHFLIFHLQLAPTLKPTPAPVEPAPVEPAPVEPAPVPVPVPVPESTIAPEPDSLTPVESQPPVQSPDYVLPGSSGAPSTDDNFSAVYPGAPSSAYIHSSSVTPLIAIGSAMIWTLAIFM